MIIRVDDLEVATGIKGNKELGTGSRFDLMDKRIEKYNLHLLERMTGYEDGLENNEAHTLRLEELTQKYVTKADLTVSNSFECSDLV